MATFEQFMTAEMPLRLGIADVPTAGRFPRFVGTTRVVEERTPAELLADIGGVDTSGTPVANDFARFTDADTIEGRSYAEVKADLNLEIGTDVLAEQTIGIADDNLVEIDHAAVADDDYAKFTANGLEGRSYAEVKADLDLEIGTDVLAEQTIGIADDNLVEVDDADAADNDYAKFTANGLEGRDYSEVRTDLGLVIGTNVQAWDAELDTLAALVEARGALVIGDATPAWSVLAVGTAGQCLQSDGTDAAWATVDHSDLNDDEATKHRLINDVGETTTVLWSASKILTYVGDNLSTHAADTTTHGATGAVVGTTNEQTLTGKTLTQPEIGDFTLAMHDHSNNAGGGELEIIKDLSPQLGADLDLNTHSLLGDGDTEIYEQATEEIVIDRCRGFYVSHDEVGGWLSPLPFTILKAGADASSFPYMVLKRSRGSIASPSACVDGDILGGFYGMGRVTADWRAKAACRFIVDGTVTASNLPTKVTFENSPTSAGRTIKLQVQSDGHIRIALSASRLQFATTTDFIQNYSSSLAFFGNTSIKNYVAAGLQVDVGVGSMTFRVSDHTSLDFGTADTLMLKSGVNVRFTIDDTGWGVMNHATAATGAAWTITNRTTDRTFDCNTADDAILADALATLIEELATHGVVDAAVS